MRGIFNLEVKSTQSQPAKERATSERIVCSGERSAMPLNTAASIRNSKEAAVI